MGARVDRVFTLVIGADPLEVWAAITDSAQVRHWFYGNSIRTDWVVGSAIYYLGADGEPDIEGILLRVDLPRRLEMTFTALWDDIDEPDAGGRVAWLLEPVDGGTRVTLTHAGLERGSRTDREVTPGWQYLLESLRDFVE